MTMPEWHRQNPEVAREKEMRFLSQWREALSAAAGSVPDAIDRLAKELTQPGDHALLIKALYDSQEIEKASQKAGAGVAPCTGLHEKVVDLSINKALLQTQSTSQEDIQIGIAALSAIARNCQSPDGQRRAAKEWNLAVGELSINNPQAALAQARNAKRPGWTPLRTLAKSYIEILEQELAAKRKLTDSQLYRQRN